MNTSKYILILSLIILLPLFAVAQIRNITKREAEQLGKNTYITSSGEVTKVVNTVGSGLDDEYSKFLFRNSDDSLADSIFSDISSDYISLEEAALDIDQLLREVNREKKDNFEGNSGLSFAISQRIRNLRKKEQEAESRAEELLRKDPTVEELTALAIEFGNRPTYYINGVEVPHTLVNQLYPNEVIKRELRTADTASGNPNGEIWYLVSERALNRIKIPIEQTYNYMASNNAVGNTSSAREMDLSRYLVEREKEKIKLELRAKPVVRRVVTTDGKYIDTVVTDQSVANDEGADIYDNTDITTGGTRVLSRSVNNEDVGTDPNDPVMKALISRRFQPTFRQNNSINSVNQIPQNRINIDNSNALKEIVDRNHEPKVEESNEKQEDTPKKSVRRIKARHQSQSSDESN